MPLFSCKFEASIGRDSAQEGIQPNNQANNDNRQPENEANPRQPNNENRQPDNEANPHQPSNENRQPENPAKPDPKNKGNPWPNNPQTPHIFGLANPAAGSIGGFPVGSTLVSTTNKRPVENMITNPNKLRKLDSPNLFGGYCSNVGTEIGLQNDRDRAPNISYKAQAPRNNKTFYNSNLDIKISPTPEAINEQVRRAGDYTVWNLSVRHKVHGEVVFLGSRDLSKVELDLGRIVKFGKGKFDLGPNIQHDPVMCTLNNITREDLAEQVNKSGGPPNNEEVYRILTALAIVANARCWSYNEEEGEWIFLTSQRGDGKQGGQTKESQQSSNDESDDDDDDYDEDEQVDEFFK